MFQLIFTITKRYWIVVLVLMLGLLSTYTNLPMYAQGATPTPDVQTVPKPEIQPTPTNTSFPTPTPNASSGDNEPIATPQPDNDDDEDSDNGNNNDDNNNDVGNDDQNDNGGSTDPGNTGNENNNSGSNGNTGESAGENTGGGTTNSNVDSAQPAKTGLTGVVAAVTLNMRKGPSMTDHIIDTLFMNEPVEITGRNSTGDWWYICCGSRAQLPGWVSAQLITPDFEAAEANTLIPIISNTANLPATAAQTSLTATTASALVVEMRPLPAFAWQGQTMDLHFVVHNKSASALTNVQLRDDLGAELAFVQASVGSQGTVAQPNTQAGSIFTIEWPEIAANERVTATVTIKIQPETQSGTLIDNLALVSTAEGDEALAGITIAMPPVALPRFR